MCPGGRHFLEDSDRAELAPDHLINSCPCRASCSGSCHPPTISTPPGVPVTYEMKTEVTCSVKTAHGADEVY